MEEQKQAIRDDSDLRKYRTELPNMADDEMGPFEYRLYGHYKRVCGGNGGQCYETMRTTAEKTQMSIGQVSKSRDWLRDHRWIAVASQGERKPLLVHIVDRWLENFTRYSKVCSPGEQAVCSQGDTDCSPGEQTVHQVRSKNQPYKNQPSKKKRSGAPAPVPQGVIREGVKDTGDDPVEWLGPKPTPSVQNPDSIVKEVAQNPPELGGPTPPANGQGKKPRPRNEWYDAVCTVCQIDPNTAGSYAGKVATTLKKAGYTPSEIAEDFARWWYANEYPGGKKDGKPPSPSSLEKYIGRIRAAPRKDPDRGRATKEQLETWTRRFIQEQEQKGKPREDAA